jgi:predicted MPP superfamily phosphohydrolase
VFIAVTCALLVVFCAILYWWGSSAFPWVRAHPRAVAGGAAAFVAVHLATRLIVIRWHSAPADDVNTALDVVAMTFGIASLPIAVLRASTWLWSRRPSTAHSPSAIREAGAITRRQAVERIGGIAMLGTSAAALGWGAARGRYEFEMTEVPVRIAGLPRALDGYVIAQISDVHAGDHLDARMMEGGFDLVRRARPDLIVVTGDLVDFDASCAPAIARRIADLPARDGITAIFGNHDYYAGAEEVGAAIRAAGIDLLVNDGKLVRAKDGGGFALLGVDDRWAKRYGRPGPLLDRAIRSVRSEAPRVLLSHQPLTVDDWPGRVALQLSGHTHGGQINPGFRPTELFLRYVAGLYQVGATSLYVNRGFGTVGPPSRIGAPPEVTKLVLVAA